LPDLISHFLSAQFTREVLLKRTIAVAFFLGVVWPDIPYIFPSTALLLIENFIIELPDSVYRPLGLSHSIFLLIIWAYLITMFIEEKTRLPFFYSLLAGMYLHVFIDLFQKKPDSGYQIFYPFSPYQYSFQCFYNDYWPYWIGFFIVILLLVGSFRWIKNGKGFFSVFWPENLK